MAKHMCKCKMCGKEFESYDENSQYCSRSCYITYRKKNGKLKDVVCPICQKTFRQTYPDQIFCSVECRVKATEDKLECTCEYCGKVFSRIRSEVEKNKHHYCSNVCRMNAMYWVLEDVEILKENFGKIKYKDMVNLFSKYRDVDEIKRKAISLGLTSSREWTKEEIDILICNYSNKPMSEVMKLLPNRTRSSILGQAKTQNLKSFYYLSRKYTQEENNYLKENYLTKTNKELAEHLNRNESGIAQHLLVLSLYRPNDRSGYNDLAEYIRGRLIIWTKQIKRNNNFTCALTGVRSNIIVHHIRSFNLILDEAIHQINFPIYDNVNDYTDEQLNQIFDTFYNLQESYKNYVCLTESVHKQFHSIYGYGDNTEEQWKEFVDTYYKQ